MINLESLKNKLEGKEVDLLELSNIVCSLGFYDFSNDGAGVTEEIIEDKNVAITSKESHECEYIINFDIVHSADEEEDLLATYVKITSVETF